MTTPPATDREELRQLRERAETRAVSGSADAGTWRLLATVLALTTGHVELPPKVRVELHLEALR
ncbi:MULTISPECIES: hypothetical protein [unclassified Streptomyces]|uniref:hypothetical protein n=1 Tax=unclassified Streptomyces TaxID=2593676 RepID=UPI0011B938A1|nr:MULTISPECIES: hypothetical protein [unclassified Streptomyces]